jgi:hypothetical protein
MGLPQHCCTDRRRTSAAQQGTAANLGRSYTVSGRINVQLQERQVLLERSCAGCDSPLGHTVKGRMGYLFPRCPRMRLILVELARLIEIHNHHYWHVEPRQEP